MSRGTSFRRVSAALGAVGLFALTLSAQQQPPAGQRRVDVLITFDRTPGPAERALVNGLGGQVRFSYTIVPGMAASLPDTAVAALGNNPRVLAIEPDGQVFGHDAELDAVWGVTRIGSGDAHSTGVTGQGVVVGVMDSGIAYDHPDLNANYLPSASWDFVNSDADPFDDNKHGSHVSGTVAAADDNSGVVGVAPSAEIAALKVLNAQGSGAWSGVIAALDKAVRDGVIDVTNSSFGSSSNPGTLVESAYDAAWAAGIVNVASAGNSGNCGGKGNSVGYPARFASVIAVGATTSSDGRPCFSSTGPDVELAAPGVSIYSTVPGGGYAYFNGTSMASPHVAGAAALLISAGVTDSNGDNHVNDEVRNILTSTAIDLGSSGRDTQFGFGLVDVVAALAALGPGAPVTDAVNVSLSTDKATYVQDTDATVTLTALVSDENGQPITGLVITDFAVLLDNAQVALVTNWGPTANAGQYTATISLPAAGMHTVQVTVNDSSAVGTGSASFNVQAASDGTATVQSVTWGGSGGKNNDKHLLVTIAIVDGSSQPIANASVAVDVTRSGSPYTSSVGTTGSNGQVTFQITNAPSGCYAVRVTTVTVGGVMSVLNVDDAGPCKQ